MAKRGIALLIIALAAGAALVGAGLGGFMTPRSGGAVVVYVAPTLYGLAEEGAALSLREVDLRSMGSVQAVRLIEAGKVPDAYLSVDLELSRFVDPRRVVVLGSFKLYLVCRDGYGLGDLGRVKIGIADPNLAPVGYRSIVALYWLSTRHGYLGLEELEESLGIIFTEEGDALLVDATGFRAGGRFIARDDLAGLGALIESGAVDCILAHAPFVYSRGYWEGFNVVDLPREIDFASDPPLRVRARLEVGEVEVGREVAFAASFTERGDEYIDRLRSIEPGKYGIVEEVGGM